MLPRDKGGVVNPTLKVSIMIHRGGIHASRIDWMQVHGTTNLRVVDLSIVPLHFVGHAQCEHLSAVLNDRRH